MEEVGKKRKIRSDKKKDCKPSIPISLRETIYRLAYITDTPVKDVAEDLCARGVLSRQVIEYLSTFLKRNIRFKNTLLFGNLEKPSHPMTIKGNVEKKRITIKFSQNHEDNTFDNICTLAYGLGTTPTMAAAILLDASIKNVDVLNDFIESYIGKHLNPGRLKELKKIVKYVNENSPYDEFSWPEFFDFIFEEVKTGTSNIKKALTNWIDSNKVK